MANVRCALGVGLPVISAPTCQRPRPLGQQWPAEADGHLVHGHLLPDQRPERRAWPAQTVIVVLPTLFAGRDPDRIQRLEDTRWSRRGAGGSAAGGHARPVGRRGDKRSTRPVRRRSPKLRSKPRCDAGPRARDAGPGTGRITQPFDTRHHGGLCQDRAPQPQAATRLNSRPRLAPIRRVRPWTWICGSTSASPTRTIGS